MIEARSLAALPGVRHGFFTREGGVSEGLYGTLNCGVGSADDAGAVAENRARVARALGAAPGSLVTLFQIHSADTVRAEAPWTPKDNPRADGVVTATPGLAVGALAADCAPVLFAEPEARIVAAAHAGWRGALAGVLEATVERMERMGADRSRIVAAVGPCISRNAYEVGEAFERTFLAADPGNARYFARPSADARPHFDLAGFAADRLRAAGVGEVEATGRCTYGEERRFFSYRRSVHRGEPDYGRQISAILLL